MSNKCTWELLSSIVTVLGFFVLTYTAVVTLRQLKEMTKTRHLEGMLKVYEMIGSDEARKKRRYLYTQLSTKPENLTLEEREIIENVSVTFDRVGKLVEAGLVPRNELLASHCEIFIRTWRTVEPHILSFRKVIGGRYVEHFEKLAKEAETYFSKHFPGQKISVVDVWSPNDTNVQEPKTPKRRTHKK